MLLLRNFRLYNRDLLFIPDVGYLCLFPFSVLISLIKGLICLLLSLLIVIHGVLFPVCLSLHAYCTWQLVDRNNWKPNFILFYFPSIFRLLESIFGKISIPESLTMQHCLNQSLSTGFVGHPDDLKPGIHLQESRLLWVPSFHLQWSCLRF